MTRRRRPQSFMKPMDAAQGGSSRIRDSRDELIHEAEILRQTPVQPNSGLLGKYAHPTMPDMTEEEFHAQMHAIATEWEQELDEYDDNLHDFKQMVTFKPARYAWMPNPKKDSE